MQIGDHLVTPRTGYTHHGLYLRILAQSEHPFWF